MKNTTAPIILRILCAAMAALALLCLYSCDSTAASADTESSSEAPASEPATEPADDTSSADTTDTEPPETTEAPVETTEAPAETTASDTPVKTGPQPQNPLTGLEADKDLSAKRPVAIMINNINIACPQKGVSKADIMYECMVEGGYTRLMMLVSDYDALPEVGSIRSSRDYYLDFAADYDAIYVHAGGSPDAYKEIANRPVDNIDGIYMPYPTYFYRDADRMKNMGYEHSLMITGERLTASVAYRALRTELKLDRGTPFDFAEWGKEITLANEAKSVHCYFSFANITDFVYSKDTNKYLRYQFNGQPHIDGETGEQLSFTNVIVLFCNTAPIPGDEKNRITYTTTGEGEGYYIYGGKSMPIKWSRGERTDTIVMTDASGKTLTINRGNTFVEVLPTSGKQYFSLNKVNP